MRRQRPGELEADQPVVPAGELLLGPARELIARDALAPAGETVRLVTAELGPAAGVIGAALVAFEALG